MWSGSVLQKSSLLFPAEVAVAQLIERPYTVPLEGAKILVWVRIPAVLKPLLNFYLI